MQQTEQERRERYDYELDGNSIKGKLIRGGDFAFEIGTPSADLIRRNNAKPVTYIFK